MFSPETAMKRLFILFGAALLSSGGLAAELRDPGAFSNIDNDDQRAIALFSEAGKV